MIDLTRLQPEEAERLAYAEGFTGVAALYTRIDEREEKLDQYREALSELTYQVRQDIPGNSGTRHLWQAVKNAEKCCDD